ncbi:MAG: RES family NAD+ phosphorylase [Elusimicrobia bacterium]|nr:RES family NAD+ phosphorylase [Elusimicrobiota bacterium]
METRTRVVANLEAAGAVRVEVSVDFGKEGIALGEVLPALRQEVKAAGVSYGNKASLDPFMAHSGVLKPAKGAVKSSTAELGEEAGEILIYSARRSLDDANNYRAVNRAKLWKNAENNRFYAGLYGAEDPVTGILEVGKGSTHFNVYRLNIKEARVLDLTNPDVAQTFKYDVIASAGDKAKAYPVSQSIVQKARAMGYDTVKVPSVKDGKTNWVVIDNFENLVKEVTTRPGVMAVTAAQQAEAVVRTARLGPTNAGTAKSIVMAMGGGLLVGGMAGGAHAATGENNNGTTAAERTARTMGTLGIGPMIDRLKGVDWETATEKTLNFGREVGAMGQNAAIGVWHWGGDMVGDVGKISQALWEAIRPQPERRSAVSRLDGANEQVKADLTPLPILNVASKVERKAITAASANVQPAETLVGTPAVNPTASVAPASVVESDVAATVKSAAPIETKPLDTTLTAETPEKKGFLARIKETVSSYKEDLKTVIGFVKDETVAFCQDTVGAMVDTKEKVVDVAQKVGDKAEDVKLKVWNFEYGLTQGLTGDSPVSLMYDGQKGDWFRNDTADSLYKGNEGLRNTGKAVSDLSGASASILNAGWQWTKNISLNTTANIYTSVMHYGEDVSTIAGATVGVVKDIGVYSADKVRGGGNWSKEKASIVAEPFARNVSASFNEMTRADPVTANKVAIGIVASVFSGDIWDKPLSFTFDARGPAVVTINGILNSFDDASNLNGAVNEMFGVRSSAMIFNQSHTKGLQDAHQVAFHEFFGAIDAPAVQAAIAIRQGIKEKGEVFVVAHSQGSAIFDAALDLLGSSEKARIHYLGLGSEKYISAKQEGLADAKNVRNAGDIVPLLGNTARASNWLIPTEWSRKIFTDWTNIDRNVPGNRHGFDQFYKQEVKRWAKEIYP